MLSFCHSLFCAPDRPEKTSIYFFMKRNVPMDRILPLLVGIGCVFAFTMDTYSKPRITKAQFGKTVDGKNVDIYTLTNSRGSEAAIITYGGTVISLKVPDRLGNLGDVVLGFDSIADYEKHSGFFGALIGRFA